MEVAPSPEVIRATQESLGQFVKRPPLTEKLLKKPPFRFLHDIITSILKSNGFFDGLFEDEELKSENVKDREAKIFFLAKVISVLSETTGQSLTVKPSKIIAGQEPEKTNELLQCLGFALQQNLSTAEAVKAYKQRTKPLQDNEKISKKSKEQLKDKATRPKESAAFTSKSTEKLTNHRDKRDSSLSNKRDTNKKDKKESSISKKDIQKDRKDPSTVRKDAQKEAKEKVQRQDREKPKSHDKSLLKTKSIDKSTVLLQNNDLNIANIESVQPEDAKEIITQSINNHVDSEGLDFINRYSPNKDQENQDHVEKPALHTKTETIEKENYQNDLDKKSLESDVLDSHNGHNENELINPSFGKEEIKLSSDLKSANSVHSIDFIQQDNEVKSGHKAQDDDISGNFNSTEMENVKQDDFVDLKRPSDFEILSSKRHSEPPAKMSNVPAEAALSSKSSMLRPPSARPPSARPGAPRPREKHDDVLSTADPVPAGKVHVIVEKADGDADEDEASLVIVESANNNQADSDSSDLIAMQYSSSQHGHLVQQILDTQKEFSQVQSGKTEIEWELGAQRVREASSQEVEQLRFNLQALSRAANPLGKLLDHIQEDVEVMRQELQQWRKTFEDATSELIKEKSGTEHALQPLQARSAQLDAEIVEKRDKINDLKSIIHKNTMRINKLLASGNMQ